MKQRYLICSGEGEVGHFEITNKITEIGLKRRVTAEKCDGDRWCKAWEYSHVRIEPEGEYDFVFSGITPYTEMRDFSSQQVEEWIEELATKTPISIHNCFAMLKPLEGE
jgi:hypothetical protein